MSKPIAHDPIYRKRAFDADVIALCVRRYVTYRLSYRDLVEMMAERGVEVAHMNPTGPEASSLRFGYYGVEGRPLPDMTKACIQWMNKDLGPEDIRLNTSNQKGLKSRGFERGLYIIGESFAHRSEHLVRHFHKLCYDAIRL